MATWMTVKQVAEYLQISEAKVYTLARAKDLPSVRVGNQWRFDQSEIDAWLKGQQVRGRHT